MLEVLVLVDHVDGAVRKPTYELLTIAKRFGEPSAVYTARPARPPTSRREGQEVRRREGHVVDDAQVKGYLVAPKAEVLQQVAEKASPAAILGSRPPPREARSARACRSS